MPADSTVPMPSTHSDGKIEKNRSQPTNIAFDNFSRVTDFVTERKRERAHPSLKRFHCPFEYLTKLLRFNVTGNLGKEIVRLEYVL